MALADTCVRQPDRLVVIAFDVCGIGGNPVEDRREGIARTEPQRAACGFAAFAKAPGPGLHQAIIPVRHGEVRIETQRLFERGERVLEAVAVRTGTGEREIRPGVLTVGPNRRQCGAFGLRPDGCRILPTHAGTEAMADRKHGQRLRIIRINGDGLFEQPLGRKIILAGHPPVVR